jgi:hypothetical protein
LIGIFETQPFTGTVHWFGSVLLVHDRALVALAAACKFPPDSTPNIFPNQQYGAVLDFLNASKPPMSHLMDAFVDFGCINAEFLLVISSLSMERIRYILDQLTPGCDGKKK